MVKAQVVTTLAILAGLGVSAAAKADVIEFIPPNDTTGAVFSTNSNDGYSGGRGDIFQATSDVTIDSVGIRQDLTNVTLSYTISQIPTLASGDVHIGETVLATGSATVTTSGLQFVDFGIAPLTLTAGNLYDIYFSFSGSSNQNFFFNNSNVPFATGAFAQIDGEQGGSPANFVMPDIRIDTAPVPEPASAALLGLGVAGLGVIRRRKAS